MGQSSQGCLLHGTQCRLHCNASILSEATGEDVSRMMASFLVGVTGWTMVVRRDRWDSESHVIIPEIHLCVTLYHLFRHACLFLMCMCYLALLLLCPNQTISAQEQTTRLDSSLLSPQSLAQGLSWSNKPLPPLRRRWTNGSMGKGINFCQEKIGHRQARLVKRLYKLTPS